MHLQRRQEGGNRPSQQPTNDPSSHRSSHVPGWGIFLIVVFLIIVVAVVGWFVFDQVRKRRLGPASRNYPARGGVFGWLESKFRSRGYRRAARGRNAGAGGLDDDVWNTRLDREADDFGAPARYDEDVGLHGNLEPYSGGGYHHVDHGYGPQRGLGEVYKKGDRELDRRYDEEARGQDPFDEEHAEQSNLASTGYRSLDPMPHDDGADRAAGSHRHPSNTGDSPTERRSMFKESI